MSVHVLSPCCPLAHPAVPLCRSQFRVSLRRQVLRCRRHVYTERIHKRLDMLCALILRTMFILADVKP